MAVSDVMTALFGQKDPEDWEDMYLRHVGRGSKVRYELKSCFTEKGEFCARD